MKMTRGFAAIRSFKFGLVLVPAFSLTVACANPPVVIPANGVPSRSHGDRWDDSMDKIAKDLVSTLRNKKSSDGNTQPFRVALFGLTTPGGTACPSGDQVAEDLTTRLFRNGLQIIERNNLNQVIKELQLSSTDMLDPNAAAKLGRLVGADGVVTGTLSVAGTSYRINARIVAVETATIAAVGDSTTRRSEVDRHGGGCE